jgi:hypothetical protein
MHLPLSELRSKKILFNETEGNPFFLNCQTRILLGSKVLPKWWEPNISTSTNLSTQNVVLAPISFIFAYRFIKSKKLTETAIKTPAKPIAFFEKI